MDKPPRENTLKWDYLPPFLKGDNSKKEFALKESKFYLKQEPSLRKNGREAGAYNFPMREIICF